MEELILQIKRASSELITGYDVKSINIYTDEDKRVTVSIDL